MISLTVASRANPAIVLPVVLSAAYAMRHGLRVRVVFEDVVLLKSRNSLEVVTAGGDCIVGEAILDFFYRAMNDCFAREQTEVGSLRRGFPCCELIAVRWMNGLDDVLPLFLMITRRCANQWRNSNRISPCAPTWSGTP